MSPTKLGWLELGGMATVLVTVTTLLRWMLLPLWIHVVRRAIAPELKTLSEACNGLQTVIAQTAIGQQEVEAFLRTEFGFERRVHTRRAEDLA